MCVYVCVCVCVCVNVEHLATGVGKQWNTLWSMGVFTQLASNTKGFAHKSADVSCEWGLKVNILCGLESVA